MDQLAPQEVDPLEESFQDSRPVLFREPALGPLLFLVLGLGSAAVVIAPEMTAQVAVIQNRECQAFLGGERPSEMPGRVQFDHAPYEHAPAFSIWEWFPSAVIPLSVEGIKRDPLADEREIAILVEIHGFDASEPAAGSMKSNQRRVFRTPGTQAFLVRLPAPP
jgi:hypothetical protein